jgi:hypothetical protein
LQANEKQSNNNLAKVEIIEISCSNSFRMSSNIKVKYKSETYNVSVSSEICSKIEKGEINPRFYYFQDTNSIFYENQYIPLPYVYLSYFCSFLVPLLIFIFYRKELENDISTM